VPIYEYRCEACGHQDEHLQKVSDQPLEQCPACGKATYRKLLSAAGFQLKGSGWYATDFKTTVKKSADSKTEPKADAKTETKTTEPKTEPKADPKPKAA
jgi:putative FmdB family regulatory protein